MPRPTNSTFNQVTQWLEKKLHASRSISADRSQTQSVPQTKGIYFWFMKKEGYKTLSKFMNISPLSNIYSRQINNETYDLVYLGTAGTGKEGNSNLQERLQWHIEQKHLESAINQKNSALSTLRTGMGALLADDLILPNTGQLINTFFQKYMLVYWIGYSGNKKEIDSDEKAIIKAINPIFNLKNNPNALANAPINVTKLYKRRRKLVEQNTKLRLQGKEFENKTHNTKQIKEDKIPNTVKKSKLSPPAPRKPNATQPEILECVEFNVKKHENISEVSSRISNLPKGLCTIELNCKDRQIKKLYINGRIRTIRKEGRTVSQFFNSPDGNTPKWRLVQDEMNDKKNPIDIITVRVCKLGNSPSKEQSTPKPVKISPKKTSNEKIKISKNFKVVMICSSKKKRSFFTQFPKITFTNNPSLAHERHPDALMTNSNFTWRKHLNKCQNEKSLLKAYELYSHPRYHQLHNKFNKDFFILSAGWGLVKSEFKLPNYDITFSDKNNTLAKTIRKINIKTEPIYKDYNQIKDNGDDILFLGTPNYIPLFIRLTQNLDCHKIIYYKNEQAFQYLPLANDTFEFRYYNSKARQKWYYSLAQDLCNNLWP
jgi:hypothetical protein